MGNSSDANIKYFIIVCCASGQTSQALRPKKERIMALMLAGCWTIIVSLRPVRMSDDKCFLLDIRKTCLTVVSKIILD